MLAIKTQTGELVILNTAGRLLVGINGNGEHAVLAEVPVGSACDASGGCSIDREMWTLAEAQDRFTAERALEALIRQVQAGNTFLDMNIIMERMI